ncbi:hypothetical protein [Paenibacillus mendelii]|uniref:Uncharacterized protein n=1 Tax=Paenibacillus mendelii TaxID=206163 RepID=A0ABV6JNE4_9BACL|nr:hypothetical protein [Paenibacillus mendelii]MCQ6559912.1 hypothetical protein [Paenibacillus mendelii]
MPEKTGMPLEDMQLFLAVSTDADPADYPELVEHLRRHRKNIVSQIAALQQVVDFIDMKLEEGRYRRDCSDESQVGVSEKTMGEPKPKSVSPVEMSYFPYRPIRASHRLPYDKLTIQGGVQAKLTPPATLKKHV